MPGISISRASSVATARGVKASGVDFRPTGLKRTALTALGAASVLAAPLACVALAVITPAHAQGRTVRVPDPATDQRLLDDATARLASNASDTQAMRDGAEAAIRLGEFDVALGFLNRAEAVNPGDARIRSTRGTVFLHLGRPRLALPLFAEAERMGARASDFAADRGLAHDLLGDQSSAQYFYAIANRVSPDLEVTRRHAFSLAVGGDHASAERMLQPLLKADDPAAWRIRAFMLAVAGRGAEAAAMLYAVLPRQLADNLAPYMRSVPRLTPGQQVAAAHLGIFPVDNSMMAGSDRLVPSGQPFGADDDPGSDP